jgi:hypothetical protein
MSEHRTTETGRQRPGEDNPVIVCACGCGTQMPKFDSSHRPRQFVSGHNTRINGRFER